MMGGEIILEKRALIGKKLSNSEYDLPNG